MSNIEILTTQNVNINYRVASLGERIFATIIDYMLLLGFIVLMMWVLKFPDSANTSYLQLFLIGVPVSLYHLLCEFFLQGQSLGKKALNLKVVRLDGGPPSLGDYILRWMFRLVDIMATSGALALLTILFTKAGQRMGDLAAGTTVIKLDDFDTLEKTIFYAKEEGYEVQFPSVKQLSDKDIRIIKEAMDSSFRADNRLLLKDLANKVKSVLQVESSMPDLQFLKRVIKDYNHVHSGGM